MQTVSSSLHGGKQCKGLAAGYGVVGSCHWFEGTFGVAWRSGCSRTAPSSVQGASTQGCEVPVFTGTTGASPPPSPNTLILAFSRQGRRDLRGAGVRGSRLHGNDVCEQCSNQRGYSVMGSCHWFGGGAPITTPPPTCSTLTRCFAWGFTPKGATGHTLTLTLSQRARGLYRRSYAKIASRERNLQGARMRGSPPSQGTTERNRPYHPERGQGCEVPACAETTRRGKRRIPPRR